MTLRQRLLYGSETAEPASCYTVRQMGHRMICRSAFDIYREFFNYLPRKMAISDFNDAFRNFGCPYHKEISPLIFFIFDLFSMLPSEMLIFVSEGCKHTHTHTHTHTVFFSLADRCIALLFGHMFMPLCCSSWGKKDYKKIWMKSILWCPSVTDASGERESSLSDAPGRESSLSDAPGREGEQSSCVSQRGWHSAFQNVSLVFSSTLVAGYEYKQSHKLATTAQYLLDKSTVPRCPL